MQTLEQQPFLITKEEIITPLIEVLDTVIPSPIPQKITQSLDVLFPEQQYEEKRIQKAKEVLGKLANEFSSEQLNDVVTEMQYLADSWLDDFERQLFEGATLREFLHEKGTL